MKNMGTTDRIIRIYAALFIGALYITGVFSGTTALILGIIAIVFVMTGLVSFCPLYVPCKINTIKKGKS